MHIVRLTPCGCGRAVVCPPTKKPKASSTNHHEKKKLDTSATVVIRSLHFIVNPPRHRKASKRRLKSNLREDFVLFIHSI